MRGGHEIASSQVRADAAREREELRAALESRAQVLNESRDELRARAERAEQGWSADLSDAAIVRTSDEARSLLAESIADDVGAIGAYIAPVDIRDSGATEPGNLREQIRFKGLTIDLPVAA